MAGMEFIIPLLRNTALIPDELKAFAAYERVVNHNFAYHKRIIYYAEVRQEKYGGCKLYAFYDSERRQYLMENYFRKIQDKDGVVPDELMPQVTADTAGFGVSILLTSLDAPAKNIYLDYKARWAIEEMFDAHKNALGFDMKYEASYNAQEGWAFIEFLSLLIYHKINGMLIDSDLIKALNVKDVLFRASTITQSKTSGSWKVCNMSKPLKELLGNLTVSVEPLSS